MLEIQPCFFFSLQKMIETYHSVVERLVEDHDEKAVATEMAPRSPMKEVNGETGSEGTIGYGHSVGGCYNGAMKLTLPCGEEEAISMRSKFRKKQKGKKWGLRASS